MTEYLINNKVYRLNIFDKLDNNSAYFIGYLAGDGIFNKPSHKRLARMGVSSSNRKTIDWIKEMYCPDSTIDIRIPINKKRPNIVSVNNCYKLTLSSKFSETFNKYGILDVKENRCYINIPRTLFRNYLKGLIDSDGHFSSGIRKDRNRLWVNFGITHQSLTLLVSIQRLLHDLVDISSFVNKRNDENCYDLKCSNIASVNKLINWLLEDESCPFEKKYQINKFKTLSNLA